MQLLFKYSISLTDYYVHFSVREGKGVVVAPDAFKNELMNEHHFSKEIIFSFFTSFVLPKGSPLKVS